VDWVVRSATSPRLKDEGQLATTPRDRLRFFSSTRWCPRQVGLVLAGLVVARLLGEGAPATVTIDDTLFRRRGKKVHGAGGRASPSGFPTARSMS